MGLVAMVALALLSVPAATFARDTDGDGLRDGFERRHGVTSPYLADTDGDGVIDSAEDHDDDELGNRGEQRFGTDPASPDSDGDGTPDGLEDHDGDGRTNAREQHQRRVPAELQPPLEKAADDISVHAPACGVRTGDAAVNTCHFGVAESDVRVALMGDSKATMYLPPAIEVAEAEGWHLVTLLKGRCTPVLGTMPRYQRLFDDGSTCNRWRHAAFQWLRADPPDLIVLVFSDDYTLVDRRNRKLKGERELRALRQGLAGTMAQLPAESVVVLLADAPRSTLNPVNCLRRNQRDMSACVTPSKPVSAELMNATLEEAVVEVGGVYRTLEDAICPFQPCPLVQGDTLVYRDKGHLTVTFTRRLAPALHAQLAPLLSPPEPPPEAGAPHGPDAAPLPSPLPSEAPT